MVKCISSSPVREWRATSEAEMPQISKAEAKIGDIVKCVDEKTTYMFDGTEFVIQPASGGGDVTRKEFEELSEKVDELQLYKFPNATIIGNPTINNGQISGFNMDNYLKFPFLVDFKNKPFVINMEFTTGANVVNQENIFDSDYGLAFAIRNERFVVAISTNGSYWDLGEGVGTYTVLPNTSYRVKFAWDGATYSLAYSLDGGKIYTTDITMAGTSQPYPKQIYIGVGENAGTILNAFSGIINLNNASLVIDNILVWQGMDDVGLATRLAVDLDNVDAAGEKKIKEIAAEGGFETDLLYVDSISTKAADKIMVNSDTEVNGSLKVDGNLMLGDSELQALDFVSKGGDFVIKDSDDGSIIHQLSKKQDDLGSFVYSDAVKESFSNNRLCVDGYLRVQNNDSTVGKDYDKRISEFRIGRDGFNLAISSRSIQEGEYRNNYIRAGNSKMELHSDKKLELSSKRGLNIGNSHSEIVFDDDGPFQIKTPWTKFSLDGNGNVNFLTDYSASAQFGHTEQYWRQAKRILKNVIKNLFHGFHVNCNDEIKLSSQKWIPYYNDPERAWLDRHSFLKLGQKEAKLMHVRYNSISGDIESKQGIKCGPYGGVMVYGDLIGAPVEGNKGYLPVNFRGGLKVVFPGENTNWEIRSDGIYCNGVKKVSK